METVVAQIEEGPARTFFAEYQAWSDQQRLSTPLKFLAYNAVGHVKIRFTPDEAPSTGSLPSRRSGVPHEWCGYGWIEPDGESSARTFRKVFPFGELRFPAIVAYHTIAQSGEIMIVEDTPLTTT